MLSRVMLTLVCSSIYVENCFLPGDESAIRNEKIRHIFIILIIFAIALNEVGLVIEKERSHSMILKLFM